MSTLGILKSNWDFFLIERFEASGKKRIQPLLKRNYSTLYLGANSNI